MKKIFFISCFIAQQVFAQSYFNSNLDTHQLRIGEQTTWQWQIKVAKEQMVSLPKIKDSLGKSLEIIQQEEIELIETENEKIYQQKIIFTSFDTGILSISPIIFKINGTEFQSKPEQILFLNAQNQNLETLEPIKDIWEVPYSFDEFFYHYKWWIFFTLMLILLVYLAYKYLPKQKKQQINAEKIISIPAYLAAIEALEKIKAHKTWETQELKFFYSQISSILKHYLQAEFLIETSDKTTHQIMQEIKKLHLSATLQNQLKNLLDLSDLVKFAKEKPASWENEHIVNSAINFVTTTQEETQKQTN